MKKIMTLAASAAVGAAAFTVAPTQASASLIGTNVTACTNSVFSGSVTTDTGQCNSGVVTINPTSAVIGAGVEFTLGSSGRSIDFNENSVTFTYGNFNNSPSADLFIFSGFSGITGLTLASGNLLDITTDFTSDTLGFLVNSPTCCSAGTSVTYTIETAAVPLPAAGLLMMGALGGFGLMRRRRKAA